MSIRKAKSFDAKYLFGTPQEIGNRDMPGGGGLQVESNAPAFVQVKPANSGTNAADAPIQRNGSGLKFSGGV